MAAVAVNPISIPTALGKREIIDVGQSTLSFQKLEDPQASSHACASRYGSQAVRSIFEKLENQEIDLGMSGVAAFEELNLSDNIIGDEGAEWLMKGLNGSTKSGEQVGSNLKVLLMPRTRMGTAGMQSMGQVLGASSSLENVILSGNYVDAEGVSGAFAAALTANASVKSLCLADCRLRDEGAKVLCDGPLRTHPTLEHVSLQYNRLGVAAAQSIANMLVVNQALRFIDLSGNSLGPEGAMILVEGIKKNQGRLDRLGLQTNELEARGVEALAQLFLSAEGKHIQYLDLRHNRVPYHEIAKIRKQLARPLEGEEGWMLLFGERQLLLNR